MRFGSLALGLLLCSMVAGDCTCAFARGGHGGGFHGGGHGGGGYHGGGYHRGYHRYGGYGYGYGWGGYGRSGYGGYSNLQQNLAWTQAHENPLSLGPYSSVPRQITSANQSYVVREYSWPGSTQPAAQLAGNGGITR